jgi:arylsulfatase A
MMTMISRVPLLALTIASAVAPDLFAAGGKVPSKPNIVFILIDDMGWADGACFGSRFYQTPNLDRLAAQGMMFTQAYAACAVCSPTRAALMTGKAPARLHITDWIPGEGNPARSRFRVPSWQQHLPLEEVTIAEALKPLGYATASIGKWHLGDSNFFPQHQGFDLNVAGGAIGHPASYFWPYGARDASHRVPGLAEQGGQEREYLTDRLTDEGLKFIEASRDRPFFLYLAHYAVHAPLMGQEELVRLYEDRPGADGQSNKVYAAMIHSVDRGVGRILAKLEELHLTDRTVVIFTSDNGGAVHFGKPPATSNAPLRLGKGYPYEGGLRVPLLIKRPGLSHGGVCNVPVISQDFFPTLIELAGAKRPAGRRTAVDGASIVPLLKGRGRLPRTELFWHYPHYWFGTNVTPYSAVRSGDWKLIRFYEDDREELYNLREDLVEAHDQAMQLPKKRRELSARLSRWLEQAGAQMPVPR